MVFAIKKKIDMVVSKDDGGMMFLYRKTLSHLLEKSEL